MCVCVCGSCLCKYNFSRSVSPRPEVIFPARVDHVCLTERQIEVYQHLRRRSESNLQHIKDVWLVLCSLLQSLNTLFNHTHTHRNKPLAASVLSAVSVPRSKVNACQEVCCKSFLRRFRFHIEGSQTTVFECLTLIRYDGFTLSEEIITRRGFIFHCGKVSSR